MAGNAFEKVRELMGEHVPQDDLRRFGYYLRYTIIENREMNSLVCLCKGQDFRALTTGNAGNDPDRIRRPKSGF